MYENVCRDQKSSLDVVLYVRSTLCFETVFQSDLGLTDYIRWDDQGVFIALKRHHDHINSYKEKNMSLRYWLTLSEIQFIREHDGVQTDMVLATF